MIKYSISFLVLVWEDCLMLIWRIFWKTYSAKTHSSPNRYSTFVDCTRPSGANDYRFWYIQLDPVSSSFYSSCLISEDPVYMTRKIWYCFRVLVLRVCLFYPRLCPLLYFWLTSLRICMVDSVRGFFQRKASSQRVWFRSLPWEATLNFEFFFCSRF